MRTGMNEDRRGWKGLNIGAGANIRFSCHHNMNNLPQPSGLSGWQ
jgi:hypothetical protein